MGIVLEHCEKIMENIALLKQSYMGEFLVKCIYLPIIDSVFFAVKFVIIYNNLIHLAIRVQIKFQMDYCPKKFR